MRRIFLLSLLCLPSFASAATASFFVREVPVSQSESLQITLLLSEEETVVNAVEGVVSFDPSLLSFDTARVHGSSIQFWVKRPALCSGTEICFSGITPGGFSGSQNQIMTLQFTPKASGTTTLFVKNLRVLEHDGKGTDVPVDTIPVEFFIKPAVAVDTMSDTVNDTEPPEVFTPSVIQDPSVYGGDWVLIFATNDKQSDIASYKIKEVPFAWLAPLVPWKQAEAPYRLLDQSRSSYIFIKASDESNNERVVTILPEQRNYRYMFGISIVFGLGVFMLGWLLYRVRGVSVKNIERPL